MEDLAGRDIERALIALKKGAQLLKYGRKGNPKIYPFRLSDDGASLIWISNSRERHLNLASVSRIIAGQRTAVFQRNLHSEKDNLAFSIIYNDGKQSLDLICKDKFDAEIWTEGLKTLISSRQAGRSKIDGWGDEGLYFDFPNNTNIQNALSCGLKQRLSSSSSVMERYCSVDLSSTLQESRDLTLNCPTTSSLKNYRPDNSFCSDSLYVALDQTNMQVKGSGSDALRVSISSVPSTSSHGSAPDDCDASGDVYMWGEVLCDNVVKVGPEKNATAISTRADVLLPKPLECCIVLDVHHIACGVRHATLVTRQGEVFSWGEESGGRLGHGVGKNVSQPRLIDSLSSCSVDLVACGEFHSCAVTMSGELYTWGDGTHNAGLLGHGTDICHWIPKRISGVLEGLRVAKVTCGTWHTALITSTGQLFTFGDGTFGALGHGNRENVLYPREVESLSGLRTIAVACGVWHTAAVVEVIVTQSSASVASGKLFTWGDGDKNRLGHGDKEPRLSPTCVSGLIDYNLHKIGCGHSLTVALTTSGLVFTMGSTVYGQLGTPRSDGKMPCLVEDNITGEYVEEISCGAYHVAVLTSKNEVFTWGKGANGRLGHGDVEDKKTPTLLEALKDRHVKFITCGANYSAAICLHKWVSGAEQSQCSACRLAFGFTRKRHNCYNCGLVHCHACSSRKAIRAVMAPNPSKPHRVCDSCFTKLSKLEDAGSNSLKNGISRVSGENKDRLDKADLWLSKSSMPSLNFDLIKQLDTKAAKQGKKSDTFSLGGSSQVSLSQLRDAVMSTNFAVHRSVQKSILSPSNVSSRSVSPFSRKASPPRSATPVPTTSGLSFSKSITESLKKTNELLNQEVHRLRAQVENLRKRCEKQESEIQNSARKAQEAMMLAAEESAKCNAAKEVIKSLAAQLKDMAERLPPGAYDPESLKLVYLPNGLHYRGANGERISRSDSINSSHSVSCPVNDSNLQNGILGYPEFSGNTVATNENRSSVTPGLGLATSNETTDRSEESGHYKYGENGLKSTNSETPSNASHQVEVEAEWIEQYEPGVYTTLVTLRDGTRDLKRVRFSRRRFGEHQAELWWSENREKVYERYNIRVSSDKSSVSGQAGHRQEGAFSPSSQF